ncbi:MAG: 30S ribosomal protein S20 [Gammaproteobacteria bacterium]|nr:30S ribosomal protein S20 [Gammaproteobacteria bacterium]
MANSAQARKRARQNKVQRLRNASQRSAMRTQIKGLLKSTGDDDKQALETAHRKAVSAIDRAARKGIEHQNKAARLKRRLNERLRELVTSS